MASTDMSFISALRRKLGRAGEIRSRYGTLAALQHAANVLGDPLVDFQATTIVWLDRNHVNINLDLLEDMEMRFLSPHEVATFAKDPANDLSESLVRKAYAGSDLCFAGLIDGRLASYGWYSVEQDVEVDEHGLMMRGPSNAAYMHNGFTHPDFRGRRLHGIGMGRALQALRDLGVDALLSDVDWANHASLRSCARLGYQALGNLYSFLTFSSGRCSPGSSTPLPAA